MYKVELSELAILELQEAYIWYDEQRSGLGDELMICFEQGIETLPHPPNFQVRYRSLRTSRIKRFLTKLCCRIVGEDTVKVESFFHTSRNPSIWKNIS